MTSAEMGFKPNQTANKLQHKEITVLHKKLSTYRQNEI